MEGTYKASENTGPLFTNTETVTIQVSADITPATVTETAAPAVYSGNWGAIEGLETTDLLVPKIFHQQAMSKFVAEGKASPGDFCDSLTGEVITKKAEKLAVIIFGCFKEMVISKLDPSSNQFKLDRIVTVIPENAREWASRPLLEEIDGVKYKNNLRYNYYCLLPNKLDEIPYVLSLGSTKTRAAKKLNTMLLKLSQLRKPSAAKIFELSSVVEKNEKGSWFGVEITEARNATAEELMRAHAWYVKSKSEKFVVTEEEAGAEVHSDEVPF